MSSYLMHYGTKGQKWGERRYQNEDGTLTPEGKIHYGVGNDRSGNGKYVVKSKVIFNPKKDSIKTGIKNTVKDTKKQMKEDIKTDPLVKKAKAKKAMKIGLGITASLAAVSVAAIVSGQLSYKKGRKTGQDEAWNDAADYSREISALRRRGQLWGDYDKDIRGLKLRDAGIKVFEPDLFGRYNKRTGRLE